MLKKYRIIIILFIILCMILIVIKGDVIKQRIVNILDYRIEKDSIFKDFNSEVEYEKRIMVLKELRSRLCVFSKTRH